MDVVHKLTVTQVVQPVGTVLKKSWCDFDVMPHGMEALKIADNERVVRRG